MVNIKRVLDAGAQSLLIPYVCSPEEARAAVDVHHVVPGHAHDRRGRIGRRRLQLAEQRLEIVRRVLAVEQEPVVAGAGDHFHRVVGRQAGPEAYLCFAGLDGALERVLREFHAYPRVPCCCQSALMPASFTTFAQRAFSLTMRVPSASGGPVRTSVPCLARNSFISGVLRIRDSSALSFSTMSCGVPAAASKPW